MLSGISDRKPRILAYLLCPALLLTLAPQTRAQQVSPALLEAAQEAYRQQQQEQPSILAEQPRQEPGDTKQEEISARPPLRVHPELLGKNVRVYYRDGRRTDGKLVGLTRDFLRLQRRGQVEQISLAEVARVKKRLSKARLAAYIAGGTAIGVGLLLLIGASVWDD